MQNWESTLRAIRDTVPEPQFQRWFKQLEFLRCDETTIYLGVPTRFHEDWLKTNYNQQLHHAIQQNFGGQLQLEFEILVQDQNVEASTSVPPATTSPQKPTLRVLEGGNKTAKEKTEGEESAPEPFQLASEIPVHKGEFFELDFNKMANQCARLFTEEQNSQVNPLMIVAGVGMGKTHLLSKIGEEFHFELPHLRVRYTNAEKFTNEMFRSWNDKSGPNYQGLYRDQVDVLLFDDIQGLGGRLKTQEAFLHIYNEILARGGRVVFTSSVQPSKLNEFLDTLRSRLLSGVTAEIRSPGYDEKLALLSFVSQQNQISVEESVLRILADQGHKDLRELLGALVRLNIQAGLANKPLDAQYLSSEGFSFEAPKEAITMGEIVGLVEHNFGISRTDLVSKSRKGVISWARQVAMYLGRRFTVMSLEDIGKVFGRDHATVLYAYEKVNEAIDSQPARRYEVEFLIQKLQARAPRNHDDCPL